MSPKPASTTFPNMETLSFPFFTPDTTVLFSYIPHLSHQQVLQTPPYKCVWSVAPSLHFYCSLDYSSSLTCICPHHSPLPSTNNLTVCLLQNTSVIPYKPQTSSLLTSLSPSYWQWHQSPALSLPSLPSFLLSSALLPPCPEPLGHLPVAPAFTPPSVRSSLSRSDWAPPPSPRYAQPPLSRGRGECRGYGEMPKGFRTRRQESRAE